MFINNNWLVLLYKEEIQNQDFLLSEGYGGFVLGFNYKDKMILLMIYWKLKNLIIIITRVQYQAAKKFQHWVRKFGF